MARPTKNNAEYFSHDAGMRNDPKIRALRKRFPASCGTCGYSVYNMLLEVLTDAEFFSIEIDEVQLELLAGDFDTDAEMLSKIIEFCVKIKLFSQKNSTISSCGLNKRLQGVIDKRNRSKEKFEKQKIEKSNVSVTETTQSKVKYSKVKESKDNNSHYYPSTAGAGVGEEEGISLKIEKKINQNFEEKKAADFEEKTEIIPIDELEFPQEEFNIAWNELQRQRFFELIQMQHEKDVEKIQVYFKTFYQEKWAENKLQSYPSKLEFFKNFFRWIPYHKSIVKNQQNTESNGTTNLNNGQFTRKASNANEARAGRDQLDAIANTVLLGAQA
ncbi:DUF4373 domain-containing protein [Pedobacter ureilyticus]|uniref:DUF4373 domain-containing protein n=1 Tax=Pedobacter ureilyticus TaxID=1393051 RepID=A0ABW9J1S5_9SPHI|nr:DUF4373 domain-containing protein [Pedobacter helvus]